MRRLVESWLSAEEETYGNIPAAAIRRMNEKRKMRLTHSRVSEWRRGVYTPSPLILSQMLFRTLPWALRRAGIEVTQKQIHELEKLIWVVGEKDGQSHVELL
jgi:hypothetical protein